MNIKRCVILLCTVSMGLTLVLIWSLFFSGFLGLTRAASNTYTVCPTGPTTCDFNSIQSAVDAAADGDVIKVAEGTYTDVNYYNELTQVVYLHKSITIQGGYTTTNWTTPDPVAFPTTLDAGGQGRVLYITGNVTPTIEGLYITGGEADGLGGYISYDSGGGVYIYEANASIGHCTIINNNAGPASSAGNGLGGGIAAIASYAHLENNHIINNTARWGGGARVIYGAPLIRNNQFLSNNSLFGGGMYLMSTEALVEDNLFQDNTGERGGGIYLSGAEATIAGNVIRDNQGNYGGGIGINIGTSANVSGNLILNNMVNNDGGGIYISYNDTRVHNNVIAHNQAPRSAGVYVTQASPIFRHNTIARNTGGDGVGVFVGPDATVALTNTIIVSHTVGITVTAGSTATLGSTLWGTDTWANDTDWAGDGTIDTTANLGGDPAFVDPDAGDYHIESGSAAYNAGVDAGVTMDFDYQPRPYQAPDIGADEHWPPGALKTIYLPAIMR